MASEPPLDVAIIGAGISGLRTAVELSSTGLKATVFEKSRGLGGRAATRRWNGLPVDHGAQFFTARSPEFRQQVAQWTAQGTCHEWTRGFHRYEGGHLLAPDDDGHPRYACREGMSTLGRALAAARNIEVERQAKVVSVRANKDQWALVCEDGRAFEARALVVTCPPPQGAALLAEAAPEAADFLRGLEMEPCLAVAAAFSRRELDWHGIQSDDTSVSWIGHDTSKRPDLHDGKTVVVIHASPAFSRENYAMAEEDVVRKILSRTSEITGTDLSSPADHFLQRWRYAQPASAPRGNEACISFEEPAPLILAGECFAGGKIEGAWLSGRAAGQLAATEL
jgi:predicted NAD/FAD-dependent oxidoreductase